MADMECNYESLDKSSCADSVVSGNQKYLLDETCVQIKEHSRCLIISGVFILIGVIIFAVVVVPKFGHGQQNDRDDSPRIKPPAQHEYMVWKIKRNLEAPANSPITNVDHEASGCPESYCKRCSANVPDSLEGDENNNAMTCPNIYCHDSLLYDELLEKFGKTTSCGRVNCCMLKWSRPEGYCKNGGSLKCFNGKEPICVCLKGTSWTGDTCETPRETQVNCSCYNKELIHDQTLSGQRSLPECLSSNKTSPWEKCHMNKDKFNCICERTENNEEARNLTLPSCDVTADPPTSAADHILSGHLTTILVFVLTVCIRNTD